MTFDAHNIMPNGEHRIYTSDLYFRASEDFRTALQISGFENIEIAGGWQGESASPKAPILVYRSVKAS